MESASKNALKAYEKYLQTTMGASNSKDTYALLSEHTHPNSICFHRYTEIVRPDTGLDSLNPPVTLPFSVKSVV